MTATTAQVVALAVASLLERPAQQFEVFGWDPLLGTAGSVYLLAESAW